MENGFVVYLKKAAWKLKRRSLDLQDMRRNPPQWSHADNNAEVNGKGDDKESVSGDWSDKSTNMNESLTIDDILMGQWEAKSKQFCSPIDKSHISFRPFKIMQGDWSQQMTLSLMSLS